MSSSMGFLKSIQFNNQLLLVHINGEEIICYVFGFHFCEMLRFVLVLLASSKALEGFSY